MVYHSPADASCTAYVGFCGETIFPYFVNLDTHEVFISVYWCAKLLGVTTDTCYKLIKQHLFDQTIFTIRYERDKHNNNYYNCLKMHQYRSLLQALASTTPNARMILFDTDNWSNFYGQP